MAIINSTIAGGGSLKIANGITKTYQVANGEVVQKNSFVAFKDNPPLDWDIKGSTTPKDIQYVIDENNYYYLHYRLSGKDYIMTYQQYRLTDGTLTAIGDTKEVTIYTTTSSSRSLSTIEFIQSVDRCLFVHFVEYYSSNYYHWLCALSYDLNSETFSVSAPAVQISNSLNRNGKIKYGITLTGIKGYYHYTSYLPFAATASEIIVGTAVTSSYSLTTPSNFGVVKGLLSSVPHLFYIEDNATLTDLGSATTLVGYAGNGDISSSIYQGYGFMTYGTSNTSVSYFKFDKDTKTITQLTNPFENETIKSLTYWYVNGTNNDIFYIRGAEGIGTTASHFNCGVGTFLNGNFNTTEYWTDYYSSYKFSFYSTNSFILIKGLSSSTFSLYKFKKDFVGTNRIYELPSTAAFTEAPYVGLALEAGNGTTKRLASSNVKVIIPSVYAE